VSQASRQVAHLVGAESEEIVFTSGATESINLALQGFARWGVPRLKSLEDAYALVGAIAELASRHLRHGRPADVHELEPVLERLIVGLLESSR